MPYNEPSQANLNAVKTVNTGALLTAQGKDNHLWASGILKPETSQVLTTLYPQYLGTTIMDRLGRYSGIKRNVHDWFELDRTRKSAEVTAGGGVTTATATLTTDIAWGPDGGYFLANDTIFTEQGIQLVVLSTDDNSGFQRIVVQKVDGTNFVATDVANGERISHIGSTFGEGSSAPAARTYLPKQRYNHLTISRRSCKVSGDALTDKTWLGEGESWIYTQEDIDMEEHTRDVENENMFGQLSGNPSTSNANFLKGEGFLTAIERGGVKTTYTGVVDEDTFQDHIVELVKKSSASEFFVPCGANYMKEMTQALKDYHLAGAVNYGVFSSGIKLMGLDLQSYKFMGKLFHFCHYNVFDDLETLPFGGIITAGKRNYSNYAAFFNLGSQGGEDLLSLLYKEEAGQQRKFVYKQKHGMPGETLNVATGDDFYECFMLSQVGTKAKALNNHGLMFETA